MSMDNAIELFKLADQNPELRLQIEQWQNSDLSVDEFCSRLAQLGQQHGLQFTADDAEVVCVVGAHENSGQLTEAELDNVAGGFAETQLRIKRELPSDLSSLLEKIRQPVMCEHIKRCGSDYLKTRTLA